MTVKCGGGTSAAKPGFDQVVIGAGLITAGLVAIAPWLAPVGVLLDAFVYDVASECPTDPPPLPSGADLSLANVIPGGVLNPNFETWRTAVQNLLLNWAWEQYCQCTSGTLAPAAYPTSPSTVVSPATTGVEACLTGHWSGPVSARNTTGHIGDWTSMMAAFPAEAGLAVTTQGAPFVAIPLPNGVQSVSWDARLTMHTDPPNTASVINSFSVNTYDAAGTQVQAFDIFSFSNAGSKPKVFGSKALTGAPKYFYIAADNDTFGTPVPSYIDAVISFHCSPAVSNSLQCCPPDPEVMTALQQIYQLVSSIYAGLPRALTSYADGTVHAGLSGNGTITLVGAALAVRVNITTDPATLGVDIGSPNYLFDRGFIVPVVNAAPMRGDSRLTYNPQTIVLPPLTEQVGYSLHPGVVVSVTELLRGP